jgi:hypothetical protein
MKKLLALVLLGGVGWFAYTRFLRPPEERACHALAALCGDDAETKSCAKDVGELKKMSKDAVAKLDTCLADAKSCVEGTGCLVGAGMGAAGQMMGDFVKGVGRALPK